MYPGVITSRANITKSNVITYALLIFLVCAVVGSAVLVAGTAASGRMSGLLKGSKGTTRSRMLSLTGHSSVRIASASGAS